MTTNQPIGHFRVPKLSPSKRGQLQNLFCENGFYFHINGLALSLAWKQRLGLGETRNRFTTVAVKLSKDIFSRLCQKLILLSGFWRYCITSTMFPVAARRLFLSLMKRFSTKLWETRSAKLIEFVETLDESRIFPRHTFSTSLSILPYLLFFPLPTILSSGLSC